MTTPGQPTPGGGIFAGLRVSAQEYQAIRLAASESRTFQEMSTALRAAGIRRRDAVFRAIRNEALTWEERSTRVASLPDNVRFGAGTVTLTQRVLSRTRVYHAVVRVLGTPINGRDSISVSFGSDDDLTVGEVRDRADDIASSAVQTYGATITDVSVLSPEEHID